MEEFGSFRKKFVELINQLPEDLTDPERMISHHKLKSEAFELLDKIKKYYHNELME